MTFLRVPVFENAATFRRFISSQCNSSSRQSFQALKTLLSTVCLRRTRDVINLPKPVHHQRVLELTDMEREQYNCIIRDSRQMIQMAVSMRGNMKHNTAVLQSLLRLRLFCNNGRPDFVQAASNKGTPTDPYELLTYLQQTDNAICVYCHRNIYSIHDNQKIESDGGIQVQGCTHLVCSGCVPKHCAAKLRCISCSTQGQEDAVNDLTIPSQQRITTQLGSDTDTVYPTKLRALLQDLQHDFRSCDHHDKKRYGI